MKNQSRRKLIKSVVENAVPGDREYVIWDSALPGFGLRVRPSGARSYIFVYRSPGGRSGKVRRVTIKATTPDQARAKAKALAGQHHGGADPAEAKAMARREASAPTVSSVLDRFLVDHVDRGLKPKTASEYRRLIEKELKPRLGAIRIAALAPKDVAACYQSMRGRPTQAASAIRVLSSAMSLAETWGYRDPGSNPARIRLKGTRRRERLFSDGEVSRLLTAIDKLEADKNIGWSVALGLRLLFATGCRAGEICDLEWRHVDLDEGVMRWPDTKTGFITKPITDEVLPLLQSAERVVGAPWVCPSPGFKRLRVETLEAGFERAMALAQVEARENATLHLIRHWFASKVYNDKTIPLPVQMKIVGHASVATAMRYAHPTADEVKDAAGGAAKRRAKAVKEAGKRGNVIRLPEAGR